MKIGQRVVFTFDEDSLERLNEIQQIGQFASLGEAVSDSLRINHALQTQAAEGFTEIIVRNPVTGQERVMTGPGARAVRQFGFGLQGSKASNEYRGFGIGIRRHDEPRSKRGFGAGISRPEK